jgi:hypothetical protein
MGASNAPSSRRGQHLLQIGVARHWCLTFDGFAIPFLGSRVSKETRL